MGDANHFGLKGIGTNVQLGVGGVRIKTNAGALDVKNAADGALVPVRAASPVGDDDVVTKRYMMTRANVIVSGQINGTSPPAVVAGAVYMCTTAGGAYVLNTYYRGESGVWVAYTPADGTAITVTTALTGGTVTFIADAIYEYDNGTSAWVLIGPAGSLSKLTRPERCSLAFGSSSTVDIGSPVPDQAEIMRVIVNVTQAFNGSAPTVTFGKTANNTLLSVAVEVDLTTIGLYIIDCYYRTSGSEQMVAYYTATSSTAGAATVTLEYDSI
jgi:hypothetical protein